MKKILILISLLCTPAFALASDADTVELAYQKAIKHANEHADIVEYDYNQWKKFVSECKELCGVFYDTKLKFYESGEYVYLYTTKSAPLDPMINSDLKKAYALIEKNGIRNFTLSNYNKCRDTFYQLAFDNITVLLPIHDLKIPEEVIKFLDGYISEDTMTMSYSGLINVREQWSNIIAPVDGKIYYYELDDNISNGNEIISNFSQYMYNSQKQCGASRNEVIIILRNSLVNLTIKKQKNEYYIDFIQQYKDSNNNVSCKFIVK